MSFEIYCQFCGSTTEGNLLSIKEAKKHRKLNHYLYLVLHKCNNCELTKSIWKGCVRESKLYPETYNKKLIKDGYNFDKLLEYDCKYCNKCIESLET